MQDKLNAADGAGAAIARAAAIGERMHARGRYHVTCHDAQGNLKWQDEIENVVATVGKNLMLDTLIAGSAYTVVGPYMGLISSVSYGAGPVAADTMASHAGWTEAGSTNAPTFAVRIAPAWSAASAGAKGNSSATSFTMTGAGTLKGAFIVTGTGAVTTLMSTAGTLFSAGLFSGGDKVVANTDVVNVTYSVSV